MTPARWLFGAAGVAGGVALLATPTRLLITHGGAVTGYAAVGVPAGSGLVVRSAVAADLGVGVGSRLPVRWPDGRTATLTVTGVAADAPADVVLSRELVRAHDPVALSPAVLLDGPGRPAAGARTLTTRAYVQIATDEEGRLVDIFLVVLIGVSVGYTVLAVGNTLLMATAARRPEFRALRLAGGGTADVLRVTSAEALLAVGVGTLLGAAVAGISLAGVSAAVEAELDVPVPIVIPWPAAAAVTAVCAAVALVATALPVVRGRTSAA